MENELLAVEIMEKFEEVKMKRAQREGVELDNEARRIDLQVKKAESALKLLGMLNNSFVFEDGKLTLLLTNQSFATMQADVKALAQQGSKEPA